MTRFIGFNIATNIIFPYLLPWQQFGYFQITIGFLSWITFYCKHFLKFSLWSNLQLWFYVLSFTNNNNNIEYESKEVINQASKSVPLPQILYLELIKIIVWSHETLNTFFFLKAICIFPFMSINFEENSFFFSNLYIIEYMSIILMYCFLLKIFSLNTYFKSMQNDKSNVILNLIIAFKK